MRQTIHLLLRRVGWACVRMANRLQPNREYTRERDFLAQLYRSAMWHERLWRLTDRELASALGDNFNFQWDSKEDSLIGEAITRLHRANGGANLAQEVA